jgi:hypothetical protein
MPLKADRQLRHITRSKQECRATLRGAFEHACERSGGTHAAVAKWLGKDPSTIRRWLNLERPLDMEALMRSSRIWPHFFRCLVAIERKARRV